MIQQDKFFRAEITERRDLADGLWMIRINPGGQFSFTAGQYATLGVDSPTGLVERPYSIVSAPHEPEIEFFFELVPHGALTPLLYERQPGDALFLRKSAKGRFTLDTKSGRTQHLLLCTVTGIAPFVSYVRMLYKEWKEGRFTGEHTLFVVHGASISAELAYRDELETLAGEVPWLNYVATISRPWEDAAWTGETGRVDDLIRKYVHGWSLEASNTTGYLCGHPEMIEHGKAILRRCRWPKEALKEEAYFVSPDESGT
jgi:ferredoxin/flavodoxin---NADP+ reductase